MKTLPRIASLIICVCSITPLLHAQVPQIINYQGRVLSGSTNFDGSGSFKFALVNTNGTTTYWSNNGSSVNGSEPSAAVTLTVTKGLYSVLLGDTSIANMTVAVPSSVFTNSDVRLRVWFNDGTHGSQLLTPDQRIATVGYTFMADNIKDGAITTPKIATGAVGSTQLGTSLTLAGTTTGTFNGSGAGLTTLSATNVTTGTLPVAQLPATVALQTGGNNFTGIQTITGDLGRVKIQAVTANTGSYLEFDDSSGNSPRGLIGADGNGFSGMGQVGQFTIGTWTSNPLAFYTSQTRRMTIDATGKVGIGIASPAAALDVVGTINIPATTSATNGVIQMAGTPIISAFGTENVFFGNGAGNFTLTGTQNTAVGVLAMGSLTNGAANTAVGYSAGSAITTGVNETAVGYLALNLNSTGNGNTAIGSQALLHATGSSNTGIGGAALLQTTTGSQNTATGLAALNKNTTGSDNTADGFQALGGAPPMLMSGSQNTAIGSGAATSDVNGSDNTAIGYQALKTNTSGQDNTAVGWSALLNTTSITVTGGTGGGVNNIGIGKNAGMNITTGNNNIDIGNVGAVESNTIRIGTSGTQTATFIAGIRGVTTGQANAVNVLIDSNGQLGTVSSSRRYKEDISDMAEASDKLYSLRPVQFRYKTPFAHGEKPMQFGLIAEEVAEVFPELAVFNNEGQPETVKYQDITPMLLNEFLKEHKRIAEMKKEEQSQLTALRSENAKLREENDANAKRLAALETRDKERDARLTRLEISMPGTQPVANTIASSKTGGQ